MQACRPKLSRDFRALDPIASMRCRSEASHLSTGAKARPHFVHHQSDGATRDRRPTKTGCVKAHIDQRSRHVTSKRMRLYNPCGALKDGQGVFLRAGSDGARRFGATNG